MKIEDGNSNEEITPNNFGQTTKRLLKELVTYDVNVITPDVLLDGRIRFDWQANSTGQTGFIFFWKHGNDLTLLTFMYDNQHPEINQRMLFTIGDSFKFKGIEVQDPT